MWQQDPWSWVGLWHWLGRFDKLILLLLAIMLLHALAVLAERIFTFKKDRNLAQSLLRIVDRNNATSTLDSALTSVKEKSPHTFANIIVSGLGSFQAAPSFLSDHQAFNAAQHAIDRASSLARADLKTGLSAIATIAALAPFVGLAGTVVGLLEAYRGYDGAREWVVFMLASETALALLPTALALVVGVLAYGMYNHLVRRLEIANLHIMALSNATLSFVQGHLAERRPTTIPDLDDGHTVEWEARYDTHRVLFFSLGAIWLYVLLVLGYAIYWTMAHPYY